MATRSVRTLIFCLFLVVPGAARMATAACPGPLTGAIPARARDATTGSQFARRVGSMSGAERESAIEAELLTGNLPAFLRSLKPVTLHGTLPGGRSVSITICVMPDYLAIGADHDFLRIPMALPTAMHVASAFGFLLPTRRMVDAIYQQAAVRLQPQPLPAGDTMRSTAYYADHDQRIAAQSIVLRVPLGALTAGDKKDLVITNRLWANPERVAIYGWHRPDGQPIQPLSTVHGARYADYSHGVRLVSGVAFVDGRRRPLVDLLEDPQFAAVLSDEGPIQPVAELIRTLGGSAEQAAAVAQEASRPAETPRP